MPYLDNYVDTFCHVVAEILLINVMLINVIYKWKALFSH